VEGRGGPDPATTRRIRQAETGTPWNDRLRFNKLKNARRVATRYDKTAESFLGFIDITSIRLWLRHLST
jgi:transposase